MVIMRGENNRVWFKLLMFRCKVNMLFAGGFTSLSSFLLITLEGKWQHHWFTAGGVSVNDSGVWPLTIVNFKRVQVSTIDPPCCDRPVGNRQRRRGWVGSHGTIMGYWWDIPWLYIPTYVYISYTYVYIYIYTYVYIYIPMYIYIYPCIYIYIHTGLIFSSAWIFSPQKLRWGYVEDIRQVATSARMETWRFQWKKWRMINGFP